MQRGFAKEVRRGLTGSPKSLPPWLFYDAVGTQLFERITGLPEYYPTRTELLILQEMGPQMVRQAGGSWHEDLPGAWPMPTRRSTEWQPLKHPVESGRLRPWRGQPTPAHKR